MRIFLALLAFGGWFTAFRVEARLRDAEARGNAAEAWAATVEAEAGLWLADTRRGGAE